MKLVLTYLDGFPLSTHELHLGNQTFLFQILFLLAATALLQMAFGIYMSHKVAGPVVKMTNALDRTASGDFSGRLKFRSGDHLEDIASSLNRMHETLAVEQVRARAEIEDLEATLARVAAGQAQSVDIDQLRERLAQLAGVDLARPVAVEERG